MTPQKDLGGLVQTALSIRVPENLADEARHRAHAYASEILYAQEVQRDRVAEHREVAERLPIDQVVVALGVQVGPGQRREDTRDERDRELLQEAEEARLGGAQGIR